VGTGLAALADLVWVGDNRRRARGGCRSGGVDSIAETAGARHRNDGLIKPQYWEIGFPVQMPHEEHDDAYSLR
jgi:hypothetical protein